MNVGRLTTRLIGLLVRWGLLKHPHGREYAREQYTLTGRHVPADEPSRRPSVTPRRRATLVALTLLLLSFTAAGILFVSA